VKALIVMPVATADIKVDAVRGFGGEVLLHGANFDEAKAKAIELAQQQGFTWVPPFDHPMVIAGQGTLALELLQQDAHLDRVFVPVGGGGLAAGVAVLIKQLMPQIKVIAVEAEDSACLKAALDAGHPVDLPRVGLFAEGVAVKRIGDETFRLCQEYLDDIVTVDSDAICAAMKDLFEDVRAVAEPSGALALAGMKNISRSTTFAASVWRTCFPVPTSTSTACATFPNAASWENSEALLAVTIPEEKGSFLKFCQLLGGRSVTEFNYRFADAKDACIFVGVRLSRGLEERKEILNLLHEGGYSVVDLSDDEMAKLHVRYMVGGRPSKPLQERLFSFEFPESPGALLKFLHTLGTHWNISLFHYRSHGTDYGRVLAAFELGEHEPDFETRCMSWATSATTKPITRRSGSSSRVKLCLSGLGRAVGQHPALVVRQIPERINKRLMQPLFCAHTPSSNGVFSSLRSRIITRLRTGSGLFSSTTSGSSATPQPSATIDTIASWPPTVA
jgi:threonine dehydratase